MFRWLMKAFLVLSGWKTVGNPPSEDKFIMVIGPHTSNWDFVYTFAARTVLGLDTRFIAKAELFRPPYGWFFRMVGGYPVDRRKNQNLVEAIASIFNSKEKFSIALAPEGTRKKVDRLKSGFYFLARRTGALIIPVGMNYPEKSIVIGPPLGVSKLDKETAIEKLTQWYAQFEGKIPEQGIGYPKNLA